MSIKRKTIEVGTFKLGLGKQFYNGKKLLFEGKWHGNE